METSHTNRESDSYVEALLTDSLGSGGQPWSPLHTYSSLSPTAYKCKNHYTKIGLGYI